jgi:hypothetical protein
MPRAAPSPADIAVAIGKVAAGDWIDPLDAPLNWLCLLYDPEGFEIADGNAHTPREAMALAWIACCSPDALIDGYVEPGSVPYEVPEGYRFELTPPWKSKPD